MYHSLRGNRRCHCVCACGYIEPDLFGEELDLLANGKIIGRGKIIILDDYYGVQVTHIIDPMERLAMG